MDGGRETYRGGCDAGRGGLTVFPRFFTAEPLENSFSPYRRGREIKSSSRIPGVHQRLCG